MVEERADALIEFWGDDVLELAGFGVHFRIADRKCIRKEALGEATTANDVACSRGTAIG